MIKITMDMTRLVRLSENMRKLQRPELLGQRLTLELASDWYSASGFEAGEAGKDRDWTQPDAWHKGYLLGKFERCKAAGMFHGKAAEE